MRNETLASLVVVAIIASAGVGYFIGVNRTPSISTSVSSSTSAGSSSEATQISGTIGDTTTSAIATTQTSTYCIVSASGTGLYVTVETDSGLPVVGALVSGSTVLEGAGGVTCEQSIGSQYTNSTGTALITDNMGSYYALSVQYQGKNYTVRAPISIMESTYVTLKVPSGNYSTSEIFEGGCNTVSGVTCPG